MLLLRVELPNVPGSLGRLATAIGAAGGDIEAIEIVEKRSDGTDVDDVLLEMVDGAMPDSVVSACNAVEGIESLPAEPAAALDSLVRSLPVAFRCEWAAQVSFTEGHCAIERASEGAPGSLPLDRESGLGRQTLGDDLVAVAPVDGA